MEIITTQLDAVRDFLNNPTDKILKAIPALRYEQAAKNKRSSSSNL